MFLRQEKIPEKYSKSTHLKTTECEFDLVMVNLELFLLDNLDFGIEHPIHNHKL